MASPGSAPSADRARTVCVIGAGLGGLALAIRLQAAGLATTLIEARPQAGGQLRHIVHGGFTFEEGPALLADAAGFADLWQLGTAADAGPPEWLPVEPVCRFLWSDGTAFDSCGDPAELARHVARLAPADGAGLDGWRHAARQLRGAAWPALADGVPRTASGWRRLADAVRETRGWHSASQAVARHFAEPHLRQAFSHPAVLSGANPADAPAAVLGGQALAGTGPGIWPAGGMAALAGALARRFAALGGTLRLHDPVVRIDTLGTRATGVVTQSGWRAGFAAVASTGDAVHTYRTLLHGTPRGTAMARRLMRREFSPSALTVHFALAGTWPGIAHHTVLIGPRFDALLGDIFAAGVLPRDALIWLAHPSVTDPALAPPGHSILRATVPVAHLGKLPIDWAVVGPVLAQRVLDEVGRRLIPDLADRILAHTVTTPRDLALDLGLHLGSGWGLALRGRHAPFTRLPHRDRQIANLYLAGASSAPGAGVAGVLSGAKAAAQRLIEDLT